MDHFLNLKDISASDVGCTQNHNFDKLLNGVLDHANSLQSSLTLVLLAHIEQS
jgi:hypothetical protein